MSTETLITFSLAAVLLSLAPGPDNLFVLLQSALYGRKAGLLITLGLCTGLVFHTTLVAVGVAALIMVNIVAFSILKLLGALYLLYLALQAYRASSAPFDTSSAPPLRPWQLYRRGILMNVSNPKVGIFFLAFLPQFVDPNGGPISFQIIMLGLIFMAIALLVFGAIAALAAQLSGWLYRSNRVPLLLHRVAAAVFTALAIRLALTSNQVLP